MRILFFPIHSVISLPHLYPVYKAALERGHECKWLAAPIFAQDALPDEVKTNSTTFEEFKPHAVVLADPRGWPPHWKGKTLLVNVGHSLASKDSYYLPNKGEELVDLHCVAGLYHYNRMVHYLDKSQIVITGSPCLDELWDIKPDENIILVAPTWCLNEKNDGIGSVWEALSGIKDKIIYVKFHLYDIINPEKRVTREMLPIYENMKVFDPATDWEFKKWLGPASIVISDISTIYLYGMALGRPAILFVDYGYVERRPDRVEVEFMFYTHVFTTRISTDILRFCMEQPVKVPDEIRNMLHDPSRRGIAARSVVQEIEERCNA